MVELPQFPRRLALTEEPKSSITSGDIRSGYASLARGLDSIGNTLDTIATDQAEKAGADSVTVGADGKPEVTKPLLFTENSRKAFDRMQNFRLMTEADNQGDQQLLKLRDDFRDNPEGFLKAANEFRAQHVQNWGTNPQVRVALDRQLQNRATGIYGGLRSEWENREIGSALKSIDIKKAQVADDLETMARRNGIYERDDNGDIKRDNNGQPIESQMYKDSVADYGTLLDEKVGNPLFRFNKDQAGYEMDQLKTRVESAQVLGDMERVYNKDGPNAARSYLLNAVKGLEGKVKSIDKIAREGMTWLRTEQASFRGARTDTEAGARDLMQRINNGQQYDPEEVNGMSSDLAMVGSMKTRRDLILSHEVRLGTRGKTLPELAAQANGARSSVSANFMTGALPTQEGLTTVATPSGKSVTVNRQAAPFFSGFLKDLEDAGAPIGSIGGYSKRPISGTNQWSQHAYGNAIDINQQSRNVTSGDFKQWGEQNRGKLAELEQKWGMVGGQNFSNPDWGHWEWGGPQGAAASGGTGVPGAPAIQSEFAGEYAKRVQGVLIHDAKAAWPQTKALIDKGQPIEQQDFEAIQQAAAVSGDQQWQQEVQAAAIANRIGPSIRGLPAAQQQAAIDQAKAQLPQSGLPAGMQDLISTSLTKQFERVSKQVADDPVGLHIERGGEAPTPLLLSDPNVTNQALRERVAITRGVAAEQGTPVGNPLRPAERTALAGAISNGNPQEAGAALEALSGLPDEFLAMVVGSKEIKAAIGGAAAGSDPVRFSQSMMFMDRMWNRAPETAKHLFGEDNIHQLMTWQTNLKYMTAEDLAKDRSKAAADPQVRERRKVNEQVGLTQARTHKFDDIVSQFGSWGQTFTLSTPQAPTDPLTRDTMMGDFEKLYAKRYGETLNKDTALKQTVEMMKTKWTRSDVNGGRLMLNAPETIRDPNGHLIYPPSTEQGLNWKWMTRQIEDDIAKETGRPKHGTGLISAVAGAIARATVGAPGTGPLAGAAALVAGSAGPNWNYTLVSDRQTEAEAQQGKPASYQVYVIDAATQKGQFLSRRYAFDPSGIIGKNRTDFEEQRARVLPVDDAVRAAQGRQSRMLQTTREAIQGPRPTAPGSATLQ